MFSFSSLTQQSKRGQESHHAHCTRCNAITWTNKFSACYSCWVLQLTDDKTPCRNNKVWVNYSKSKELSYFNNGWAYTCQKVPHYCVCNFSSVVLWNHFGGTSCSNRHATLSHVLESTKLQNDYQKLPSTICTLLFKHNRYNSLRTRCLNAVAGPAGF